MNTPAEALANLNRTHREFFLKVSSRVKSPYVGQGCIEDLEACITLLRNGTPLEEVVAAYQTTRRELADKIYAEDSTKHSESLLTDEEQKLLTQTLRAFSEEVGTDYNNALAQNLHQKIKDSI